MPADELEQTRRLFLACFASAEEAEAFIADVLADPRERQPPEVLAVLDGGPRAAAFYDYLFSQLHTLRGL